MTVREKLVWAVLQTYSPLVPHQNQTFVNSKAEELFRAVATHSNLEFTASTICNLIREQEPPRLQAVLRLAEHQIKVINSKLPEGERLGNQKVHYLLTLSKALAQQMGNPNADVRKTVVFCLVEICQAVGLEVFQSEVVESLLNPSQQKLVHIYIQRR